MGLFKADPPEPPNPLVTASAQTSSNVDTATANSYMNNVNQNTPQGSLSYDVTGTHSWTDPTTGRQYNVPTWTSTQTQSINPQTYLQQNPDVLKYAQDHGLNPSIYAQQHYQQFGIGEGRAASGEAGIYNQNQAARGNLAGIASDQSAAIRGMLNTPFNPGANAPGGGNAQNLANIGSAVDNFSAGGPIQSSIGPQGPIATTYGGADNYSADRDKVEAALMARINPQLDIQQNKLRQQLADQGIKYGSAAYNNAFQPYNQQRNDAQFGAIAQAGQEQQRMNAMAAQAAAFQNAGQQQGYEQAMGMGTFANTAQAQQFGQNAQQAQFTNAARAQQLQQQQSVFNAQNAQRNQYMQEQFAQRNQPLQEINALQSGSQVSSPNWLNSPQSQIPTTDIAGLYNTNFNQQFGNYQTQQNATNQLVGGALGGLAGVIKSDRREKENINRIGTVFAADSESGEHKKLPIYKYSYKEDPASTRHTGPMAQEVERINPDAVVEDRRGTKYIKPSMVMGSILKAA